MKKILFAASECVPFIKTGGLADVCGALPKEFDPQYWDIRVVIPNYSCIPEHFRSQFEYVTHFYMGTGSYIPSKYVGVLKYELDGITYYFIDNKEYFDCFSPYGNIRQDIEKFCFFDKAVLSMLPVIGFQPDIIHCHDWETGLIPVYLKNEFQGDMFFWGMKSVMTIHNLKFQGVWDIKTMQGLTGLPASLFTPDKLEYKKDANMLKGGLVYADYITTVSDSYANEIQTENAVIRQTKIERLKSNSMGAAFEQADAVMGAASDEIMGMLIAEGKDHIDEKQEEEKKTAEEAADKKKELEEKLQARKDEKNEQEELTKNIVEAANKQAGGTDSVVQAQQEIKDMMNKLKLVEDDVKGAAVDQVI